MKSGNRIFSVLLSAILFITSAGHAGVSFGSQENDDQAKRLIEELEKRDVVIRNSNGQQISVSQAIENNEFYTSSGGDPIVIKVQTGSDGDQNSGNITTSITIVRSADSKVIARRSFVIDSDKSELDNRVQLDQTIQSLIKQAGSKLDLAAQKKQSRNVAGRLFTYTSLEAKVNVAIVLAIMASITFLIFKKGSGMFKAKLLVLTGVLGFGFYLLKSSRHS
jgi:hypothetical protein